MGLAFSGLNSTVWNTAIVVLVVVPLTLLWLVSLGDTVRRRDLSRGEKLFWLVVLVPFPVVGTLVYLYRRPGWRAQARTLREGQSLAESRGLAVVTLDDFASTAALAQATLAQSVELLDEVIRTLSGAKSTAGRSVPLTHVRPLGLVENRLGRLTVRMRSLREGLVRLSAALGTNADDLQRLARQIETLSVVSSDGVATPDTPGSGAVRGEADHPNGDASAPGSATCQEDVPTQQRQATSRPSVQAMGSPVPGGRPRPASRRRWGFRSSRPMPQPAWLWRWRRLPR